MEQLVRNRFWIACGAAVLLALGGWFFGKKIRAQTEDRRKAVAASFDKLKGINDKTPTKEWADQLAKINEAEKEKQKEARKLVFEAQAKQRHFPPTIEKDATDEKVELTYKGVDHGKMPKVASAWFKEEFVDWARKRFFKLADPHLEGVRDGRIHYAAPPALYFELKDSNGKVAIVKPKPVGESLLLEIPQIWQSNGPVDAEAWKVMEDQWLYESLFEVLAQTNAHADTILNSPVKVVEAMILRGGSRTDLDAKRKGSGAAASPIGGPQNPLAGPATAQPAKKKSDSIVPVLNDIFGNDQQAAAAAPAQPALGGLPTTSAAVAPKARYVDGPAGQGAYLTRGFYLKLIMRAGAVPEVLDRIRKSPWKGEILCVHRGEFNGVQPETSGGSSGRAQPAGAAYKPPESDTSGNTGAGLLTGSEKQKKKSSTLQTALNDPRLVRVVICGLFHIAKPEGGIQPPPGGNAPAAPTPAAPAYPKPPGGHGN